MTIRQILNRINDLATLAAQCLTQGAKQAAAEFYNIIYGYQLRLMAA